MPKTDYKLTIDDSDVEKSLKTADEGFDKMQKSGDDAMKGVEKSAAKLGDTLHKDVNGRLRDANGRFVSLGKSGDKALKGVGKSGLTMSGVLTGSVGGAFTSMAGAALQFGQVAVATFADVIKSSTQAANEFDVTKKKFVSIFEGGEKEAGAVMEKIGKKASSLGLDLNEALSISRAFLPDVKGTEDPLGAIDNLLVGVRALAEEDPAQGIIGARVAIDEAMSGSLRSLKARFEFTKAEVDILERAQGELGQVVGTIEGINQVMQRRGVDVEALKGTFTQAMGEMQFATSKLQIALGKPIADQLTESLGELNKLVTENSDDLQLLAGSIGDVVANVIDFISTDVIAFLQDFDVSKVQEVVDSFNKVIIQIGVINELLPSMDMDSSFLDDVKWLLDKTAMLMERFQKFNVLMDAMGNAGGILGVLSAEGETFSEKWANAAISAAEGNDDLKKSFLDTAAAIEKGKQKTEELEQSIKDRKAALNENTAASLADAEAFLKEGDAAQQAASELEKLGLSEEKLQAIQKNAADTLDKRLELEKRFSQERADIHRKSIQDIADIESDHQQDIVDAGRDLSRSARDLALKQGQERSDVETQNRRQLIDIEEAYQDELARIQRQTQLSLESAELSQDALAFVDALRQQEIAQEEAAITRGEAESDIKSESEQRLADLEVSQAAERAVLDQSQQDKLLDLQLSLEQELANQQLAEQRSFEQQAISEQRKLDNLAESESKKLAELTKGLDAEVAAVIQAEAEKLSAVENFAASATATLQKLAAQAASVSSSTRDRSPRPVRGQPRRGGEQEGAGVVRGGTPGDILAAQVDRRSKEIDTRKSNRRGLHLPIISRMLGGSTLAGHIYKVGERGIEGYVPGRQFGGSVRGGPLSLIGGSGEQLFAPPKDGNIIPNNQLGAFLGNGGTTNNSSTEINFQPEFQLSNPAVLSPEQAAQTRAIASSVAAQMFQQVLGGNR